jgi:hypothetical protein
MLATNTYPPQAAAMASWANPASTPKYQEEGVLEKKKEKRIKKGVIIIIIRSST